MKRNNKGFSLVELLVSFAILGIISVIIGIILTSGSNMFTKNKKVLSLQYKSQVTSAQLHNHLQNCNAGIAADENSLWAAHKEDENNGEIFIFTLDDDENTIYLRTFDVAVTVDDTGASTVEVTYEGEAGPADPVNSVTSGVIADCVAQPFCSGVESWQIETGPAGGTYAKYATVTLNLEQEGSSYSRKTAESFRNRPLNVDISGISDDDKTDKVINTIFGLE
ncbi:MAG: prepilin-type N-terminal cleavage/methylation domain-containing protein [Clostridia bacterium]|nr:prepilin-type N-terminal cleavage/methylation domain-containing protein [Clostridia bacterium]